jgi:hypothetical protein
LERREGKRIEQVGVGIAIGGMGAGAGGSIFGVGNRVEEVRFKGMPFAPSGGDNVIAHYGVREGHGGKRAPGPA